MITLGVGLELPAGTRHWLKDVAAGDVGVFMPGDEHDALYVPGSVYAAVTLAAERVEEAAAQFDLVLDPRNLGGTGVYGRPLPADKLASLQQLFRHVHSEAFEAPATDCYAGNQLLPALIVHLGCPPRSHVGSKDPRGYARIVARARAFIHENLGNALSVDMIARAVATSQRTLHRSFRSVLDETPYSYVQKLLLHRIRQEIIADAEAASTLACIANHWGLSELGRVAGWYKDLYGELPSETRKRLRSNPTRFGPLSLAGIA